MTEIQTFRFGEQPIRTVTIGGEPWFVGADVCAVLGIANGRDAVSRLDPSEKDVGETDTPGGRQKVAVISEPGLYRLVMRSNKPDAVQFQMWIAHEVLPALRRTGRYEVAPQFAIPQTLPEALRLAADQAEQIELQRARLAIAEPKAEYVDGFVGPTEDASQIRVFANQLGVQEKKLRGWMEERGLIYRDRYGQWKPRAGHPDWFVLRDQPEAPRLHNDQMRTTLYVTPIGKTAIRRLAMRHPIGVSA